MTRTILRPGRAIAQWALPVALFAFALPSAGQVPARTPPPARAEDVASVDAIITAIYDVISGPAGQKRDWQRFESLFVPGARLIPTVRGQDGAISARVMTPADYAENAGSMLETRGFFEVEIARVTESFGSIAHAFSTYESRWKQEDPEPFQRGINSMQLLNDGTRWWVVSIYWDAERPDNPIPDRYLGKGR